MVRYSFNSDEQMASDSVTDNLGLVQANQYMVVFIPASKKALPFRVITRKNYGRENVPYGALPVTASTAYSGLTSADTVTGTAAVGQIPGRAYNSTAVAF